jgi:hypothetical protein
MRSEDVRCSDYVNKIFDYPTELSKYRVTIVERILRVFVKFSLYLGKGPNIGKLLLVLLGV